MKCLRQLCVCLFLVLCASGAWAAVSIDESTQKISLAGHLSLLVDDSGTLDLADAIAAASYGKFRPLPGFLNRGYTQSTSWLSFSIQNTTVVAQTPKLQLQPHYVDEVDVYVQHGGDPTQPDNYQPYQLV